MLATAPRAASAGLRPHTNAQPRLTPKPPGARLSEDELASLVTSAALGSELAWECLMREFSGLLWAVTRTFRLSDADAADVIQATWVRLVEHLNRLAEPGRVGAWLATTARRECLRILRERQRQVVTDEDPRQEASTDLPPDTELLTAERDQALWRGFARLRKSDQALLRLLIAEPRPAYEEISAVLDVPIGSIGPTRARALERLRRELDDADALVV